MVVVLEAVLLVRSRIACLVVMVIMVMAEVEV